MFGLLTHISSSVPSKIVGGFDQLKKKEILPCLAKC